jgi:hypothetical protein
LVRLPALRLLKMPGTAINQLGVTLSGKRSVPAPPPLHEVDVRRTKIDDPWLAWLTDVRTLRILRIAGCNQLSEQAIAAFRKARPEVKIVPEE